MTVNYTNNTEFFHLDNHENVTIYNRVCERICDDLMNGKGNNDTSVLNLAKVHDHMRFREKMLNDFMELWRDEDYAVIIYADTICDERGNYAFVVAFAGKGFNCDEVNIYEF